MRTLSAAMQAAVAAYGKTLVLCVKVKRQDGTIYAWTEHDQNIAFDNGDGDGTQTYRAAEGFEGSALKTSAGLTVDDSEFESFLSAAGVSAADLRAGLFDFADVWVFWVNWSSLWDGAIKIRRGKLGRVTTRDDAYKAEVRSLFELLNTEIVRLYLPACPVELGSSVSQQGGGCGVQIPAPYWAANTAYTVRAAREANVGSVVRPTVWNDRQYRCVSVSGSPNLSGAVEPTWPTSLDSPTGTVVDGAITWQAEQDLVLAVTILAVTDRKRMTIDYTGTAPAERITGGRITFTSGLNVGLTFEIKRYTVSGAELDLFLPATYDVNAGSPNDTATITLGCDHSKTACKWFDNIWNFQGFAEIPGNDQIFKTPNVAGG